ncbi:MAG TPA: DUF6488 family protein [Cellvibrionaceae bacterium]
MKNIVSLILTSVLLSTPVLAHEFHDHISDQSAPSVGLKTAADLTKKDAGLGFGKLPASWAAVPVKNAKIHKKGKGYYVVAVANSEEKKTLYVLISDEGEAFDANFTGDFNDIK